MKITLKIGTHTLIENVLLADTFRSKLLGYMFQKAPKCPAILFKDCNSIHTFFMNFKIDVLFLDVHLHVIKKIEGLDRRKMIFPIKEAVYVVEGPENAFKAVAIGEAVCIQ